jgi:hypothetical protein
MARRQQKQGRQQQWDVSNGRMQERLDTILSLKASGVGTDGTAETQTLETLLTLHIFLQTWKPKARKILEIFCTPFNFLCTCELYYVPFRFL